MNKIESMNNIFMVFIIHNININISCEATHIHSTPKKSYHHLVCSGEIDHKYSEH